MSKTTTNRAANVQTPGTPAEEVKQENAAPQAETVVTTDAAPANVQTPEVPAADPEEVARLQAENEELRAQIAASRGQGDQAKDGKPAASHPGRKDYLSMSAKDVDPATLTKAVLTKDGWVAPLAIKQDKS